MNLTINKVSALKVLRMLRRGELGRGIAHRCNLRAPSASGTYWTRASIEKAISCIPGLIFSDEDPLDVAIPKAGRRIRVKGINNTCYSAELPTGAFLDLGNGIAISSPEMLFLEMADLLPEAQLLLLGMELCGSYALAANAGMTRFSLAPVTSVDKIRDFLSKCRSARGMKFAQEAADLLLDNAWSPMEAVLATLLVLPITSYGYEMSPLVLNRRLPTTPEGEAQTRVPDILFPGTQVGINYEGEGHLGLSALVEAAREAERHPETAALQELDRIIEATRRQYVEDRRRDRDLLAMGQRVLPVVKEDLYKEDALDRVVLQLADALEKTGARDCTDLRKVMKSSLIRTRRRQLIKSLLPGSQAEEAMAVLERLDERGGDRAFVVEEYVSF